MRTGLLFLVLVSSSLAQDLSGEIHSKMLAEIKSGKTELSRIPLKVSTKVITYIETRQNGNGSNYQEKIKDFAQKEIAIKLFNLNRGFTRTIRIKKLGPSLVNLNKDFVLEIEPRLSGIRWNGFNTAYRVVKPSGWVVILNKYPTMQKNKKRKDIIYAPYSTSLHAQQLIVAGQEYLIKTIASALTSLDANKKHDNNSRFIRILGPLMTLVLIEQTDAFEFYDFINHDRAYNPLERVSVIIAINGDEAYSQTSSPASASGLMQYTKPTWKMIRKEYPWAKLPPFETGVTNHTQSIRAAALLYDHNIKQLKKNFGEKIMEDLNLEHSLAAGYNGGIGSVIKAIAISRENSTDWRVELRKLKKTNESLEYLEKLDYILKTDK